MEVESAILFNVNPPSPQGSDYYSDEQDIVLRTWHAGGGPLVEQPLQYSHSMPHHLAEKGYCGIITAYEYAASFDPDSINTLTKSPAQPADMSFGSPQGTSQDHRSNLPVRGSLSSGCQAGEGSNNSHPGFSRKGQPPAPGRRGPGELNRKSELYGDQCQFAHSKEELQRVNRHPRYKTQFCMSFQAHGYCKYNERCTFIHHPEEARVPLGSIPGYQGNTEDSTCTQTPGSTSSAKGPRADRTRALSDPGFASTSSVAGELTDGRCDSGPYHETRRRSNVSYPPDLLYKLAHPQMVQFMERERTASAFPLVMERESMMARENIMRENLAMARESMRKSMHGSEANAPSVESINPPSGALSLSTVLEALQLTPQLQVSTVPEVQVAQVQDPQAQISLQTSATVPPGIYPPMAPPDRRVAPTGDSGEVDEQWARAMAAYISTSDNEFEM
ncbi:mRNA decay activator protein zfp36 [Podila horticola]|nr:mRNA decay activator protein zfp36 [Podila horticola]